MRRIWRIGRWILLALVVAPLPLGLGGYFYLRQSLPEVSGTVKLLGVSSPVEVVRDGDAIPHIFASSRTDALFALGYVHAQDRLWQMEFQRRLGQGRLSEVFGASTVAMDRFLRTLGMFRAAQSASTSLPNESQVLVNAYVNGVNAFISECTGSRRPPEFVALGIEPEAWTAADVLTMIKLFALTLSGDLSVELLRSDLIQVVGAERASQLLPDSPATDLTIVEGVDKTLLTSWTSFKADALVRPLDRQGDSRYDKISGRLARAQEHLHGGRGGNSGIGSNGWVVDGSRSTTGKPLLANDLHLGAQLPSAWYLARLSAPDLDVVGATAPGLPGVVIGRNRSIAWGITNLFSDTQDLFLERLDDTGQWVEFQGEMEPIETVTETIKVRGQTPIEQTVRLTRHGPIVSDTLAEFQQQLYGREATTPSDEANRVLALRWTALDEDDTTIAALFGLNLASNWDEFRQALRSFVAPALSFIYADVEGNIGYYAAGRFPVRRSGDGALPAEGWSGNYDWTGFIPEAAVPQLYNPPQHMIVTANNRPVPVDYPHLLGRSWEKPYRAERIRQLLLTKERISPQDMATYQSDRVSLEALELLPQLMELVTPRNEDERAAIELLSNWDGNSEAESTEAAIFAAWCRRLPEALLVDDLGMSLAVRYEGWTDLFVTRFLLQTLRTPDDPWCDDVTTPQREECGEIVQRALQQALQDLRSKLGSNREDWRWGQLHKAVFAHQPFGAVGILGRLFNRTIATGGGTTTVNLGQFSFVDSTFVQSVVPSYRQVVDLSKVESGEFILALGQSGHPLSTHYDDYSSDWQVGRYRTMRLGQKTALSQQALLRLEPRKP